METWIIKPNSIIHSVENSAIQSSSIWVAERANTYMSKCLRCMYMKTALCSHLGIYIFLFKSSKALFIATPITHRSELFFSVCFYSTPIMQCLKLFFNVPLVLIIAAIDQAPTLGQHHPEEFTLTITFIYYSNSMMQELHSHLKN